MPPASVLSVYIQARGVVSANRELMRTHEAGAQAARSFDQVERGASDAAREVEQLGRTRATVTVMSDTSAATRGIQGVKRDIASIGDKTVTVRVRSVSDGGDSGGSAVTNAISQANVLQRTIALVKPAAMIASLGFMVQAMAAAAAGAIALGGALAPLAGVMAAYPAMLAAAAQGMSVFKLAMKGVGPIGEDLAKALDKPTGAGRRLSSIIDGLTGPIVHLRNLAQGPILRGLADGVESASGNLSRLNPIVRATANVLGGLAREAGELVGSSGFGRDLTTVGMRNAQILQILGRAAIDVGDALRHVVVAAGPLTMWLARVAGGWAENVRASAEAGRESGRMAAFFERTRAVMERLGSIAGSLGTAFWNIAKGAGALGGDLLASLDKAAAGFAAWTESVGGQNQIAEFFERARGPIYEVGKLIRDVTHAFLGLSQQPGLEKLIKQFRTELLPVLVRVMNSTTAAFGPAFIDMISAVARAFEPLAGASGPLILYVKVLTSLANAAAWIATNVPGAGAAITLLVGAFAVSKAIGFAGAITGVTKAITAMRVSYLVSAGAITAETTAQTANNLAKNVGIGTAVRHTVATVAGRVAMVAGAVATGTLTAAQWLLNAAMLANPIGLVIVAIAALVGAFVLLGGNLSWIGDVFSWLWGGIKAGASAVLGWLTAAWPTVLTILSAPVKLAVTVITGAWALIQSVTSTVWTAIKTFLAGVWSAIVGVVTGAVGGVRSVVSGAWNAISGVTSSVWNTVKNAVSTAIRAILGVVTSVAGEIKGVLSGAWNAIADTTREAWNTVKSAITGAVKSAFSAIKGLVGDFLGVGGDIVRGIANGIRNAAGAVWDALKGAVKGAIDKVKGMLGIGSPSKLFAQYGGWVGQGLAGGILGEAAAVSRAASALADAALVMPSVAGATGAPAATYAVPGGASNGSEMPGAGGRGGDVVFNAPVAIGSQRAADALANQLAHRLRYG